MIECLERLPWRLTGKLGVLAVVCVLAGCDSAHVDQDSAHVNQGPAETGEVSESGYRLFIQVIGIDFKQVSGGTLFTVRTPAGAVVASAGFPRVWNSYCANDLREMHVFTSMPSEAAYTITRLSNKVATLKTGYAFAADGALQVDDRGNVEGRDYRRYQINFAGGEAFEMVRVQAPEEIQGCSPFIANNHVYSRDAGLIYACALDGTALSAEDCETVAIDPRSYPYDYAEYDGRVVVVTNWGDVLIHGPGGWCRAENVSERYACPSSDSQLVPGPATPTGVQFYSSIHYQGKTYLGKYPDGRLYEFDGESLVPSADSPPSLGDTGSELQSLAIYCGDLFAGRWPRGTVWRRDRETGSWERVARLFSHPADPQPRIPYFGLHPEGFDSSFYGQRVSSLALLSDSLFASTSNLNSWDETIGNPDFLTSEQAEEYGALHRIRRPGCATAIAPDVASFLLRFDFTPETITVRHNGKILVQVENNGTVPSSDDQVNLGDGVFGRLSGVGLRYWNQPPRRRDQ